MSFSHIRRRRSGVSARLILALASAMLALGCSPATSTSEGTAELRTPPADAAVEPTAEDDVALLPEPTAVAVATPTALPTPPPIAAADTELPRAPIGFDDLFANEPSGPQPVSIEIENINVRDATIIPVGVNNDDLSFEVPPADQVGWYEHGPLPGEAGSAVLAAHIAFNGEDGVFRYLENVEIGAIVIVGFDDGTSKRYRIEAVTEYDKFELPDSVWARDGREQLALITCGGAFNYDLDSYESNTVAIAVPA